jgi:pyruvate,water dikinase
MVLDAAKFVPPEPGAWELEQTHLQRPVSRWVQGVFPPNMMRGFKESMAKYGLLLSHLETAIVEEFAYVCPRPVGAPQGAKGSPPKLVFKLLTKLHPEIRRRMKRSREVWVNKTWREDVKLWYDEWGPAIAKQNRALATVDPRSLDDAALAEHLVAVHARCVDAVYRHHSLNGCSMLPIGDFLAHAMPWTKEPARVLLALLTGASPASCGARPELRRLAAAIRADAAIGARLASTAAAGEILDALRAAPGEIGEAAREYVLQAGLRLVGGYDIGEKSALEMPELLVGAIRCAVADTAPPREAAEAKAVAAETARVRALVPEEHRVEFDELLAEARLVYPIRDERGYNNDGFAMGLARRALLVVGERLVARGKLESADHAIDLSQDEALALFEGKFGPSREGVAARYTYRNQHTVRDAPAHLGLPPSKPPPAEWLPPAAARSTRAVGMALQHMFETFTPEPEHKPQPKTLRGLPASPGTYEGRARVVSGPDEFAKIEKGDILVARMTSPSYNVLLPLLGGVVTDRGGLLSHAAIVAREYGLPAVVGTVEGTRVIPDRARVRVDGATGEVQVL